MYIYIYILSKYTTRVIIHTNIQGRVGCRGREEDFLSPEKLKFSIEKNNFKFFPLHLPHTTPSPFHPLENILCTHLHT